MFIFFAVFFLFGSSVFLMQAEMLSIEELYKKAFDDRSILSADFERMHAQKYAERTALTQYFPQITFFTDTTKNTDNIFPRQQTTIEISQNLFNFSAIQQYRAEKQRTDASLFEHQTLELQVQFELEKAIIAAWSSTKKQSLIQAQAIAAPIQFDAAKNEYASGLSEVVQLSTAQAQYTENGVQIKRYADEYNSAYSDLYRATETDEQFQIDDKRIEQWIDASLKTIESRALGDYVAYALSLIHI